MIIKFLKGLRLVFCNCMAFVFRICPIKKRKIFITSYYGKGYGDNPKYIIEALLRKEKNVKIIWAIRKESDKSIFPEQVQLVYNYSIHSIYHLATAKIWIDNCRKIPIMKRKKQVYIQTWHGFALKRIEKDAENVLSKNYVRFARRDSKKINIIVSDSQFMTRIYQKSFWYNGAIVEWGMPRTDIIVKGGNFNRESFFDFYHLDITKKIILYAPTFRANQSTSVYNIDYNILQRTCKEKFGEDFVVLVRLHPNIMKKCNDLMFNNNVINMTYYPDIQELLLLADICITDYSSLMFDFALSKKPCFLFATDIELYKKDRNFYFDIEKLPFPLCKDNPQLQKSILDFDMKQYNMDLEAFFDKVGMIRDGKASERCVRFIEEQMGEKRNEKNNNIWNI